MMMERLKQHPEVSLLFLESRRVSKTVNTYLRGYRKEGYTQRQTQILGVGGKRGPNVGFHGGGSDSEGL